MVTKIQKWGNSQGLRVSRQLLDVAQLAVGDEVDVVVRDGTIIIVPIRQVRGKYRLAEIVRRIPKNYKQTGEAWGSAMGREVW